jgi:hypothetical protein
MEGGGSGHDDSLWITFYNGTCQHPRAGKFQLDDLSVYLNVPSLTLLQKEENQIENTIT